MTSSDLDRQCAEIADRVEPGFRVTHRRSCTGHYAKRWNAAFVAAHAALASPLPQPLALLGEKEARGILCRHLPPEFGVDQYQDVFDALYSALTGKPNADCSHG